MAESRFADCQRDKVHKIDKGIKNIFKWEWLHNTVNETPLCDFIRKIKAPGKVKYVWCDQEILWYFGKVSRNASEEWLLSPGYPKGTFLIRKGEAEPDTFTLSIRDCDELNGYLVKHYKIQINRGDTPLKDSFFITPKRSFVSLPELVDHYREVSDGLCCRATQVCVKPRSLLWTLERGKQDEFATTKDSLQLIRKIGSGQFADVWLGKWCSIKTVAVKIQKKDSVTTAAFLDEAQVLKTLQHGHIIRLLAVCNEIEPVYLVTEYMINGRLSLYLREGNGKNLGASDLLWISAQIADAMAYMEKENFVHRNLGARNILVGEQNRIKVAGYGMTKVADDPDFNFRRGLKMAIKWMAPEVLKCNKYSTKADVWSFAIVLIEIFSYGKEPYEGMGSKEAFENVQNGYRIPRPSACPIEKFLEAERTDNWLMHLHTIQMMLPYLAAAGHNLYVKSAYVYLCEMQELEKCRPDVYAMFEAGHHVLRRSDRYWARLSIDIVIEQVLIRSMKTSKGLTRGRGMTEFQRVQWLLSSPVCAEMDHAMQNLTGVDYHSSEQHKEAGKTRQARDNSDAFKILRHITDRKPL
ncbi:hypothetical protein ScPMuIL_018569 [Solemya velum]